MGELQCYVCASKIQQGKSCQTEHTTQQEMSKRDIRKSNDQDKDQSVSPVFVQFEGCSHVFCSSCAIKHQQQHSNQTESTTQNASNQKMSIFCQECQQDISSKYCSSCQQFLCQKCSFKIHNKGKRAKHKLDSQVDKMINTKTAIIFTRNIVEHIKHHHADKKEDFIDEIKNQVKISNCMLFLSDQNSNINFQEIQNGVSYSQTYDPDAFSFDDIVGFTSRYPFLRKCVFVITQEGNLHLTLKEQSQNKIVQLVIINLENRQTQSSKLPSTQPEKNNEVRHNKNLSTFSNFSAISKIQHQSVLSNEPSSQFFQNNELSVTINPNESVLMKGELSQQEKQEKLQREDKMPMLSQRRMQSIQEENSHNSAVNISSSTQNSIRKRNKRWPIPYFQPYRMPKYDKGPRYNAQCYLRDLAQKGILMVRKEKAQNFILDRDLTRQFVRSIGEQQIQYVAYIIDFLSVQCLTWVIQSVKEDKMTPSEKLIVARLKQSFDLKISNKLWDSIVKYFQSREYQQDYIDNTKNRYVPKISVVRYGQQFLLEFQQRKWPYEDQDLLDEQEEEWIQFTQLITQYFSERSQITGGRYGCVQYVKLNGPKPLRKCSLGKLCMFVQQAINKGIIRYHKTLLVSNSQQNNTSVCSGGVFNGSLGLMQMQKQIKIMALQIGLIDMFYETTQNTPISMAQIPLNLKTKIMFDINLVQLGFPKLKNLLATLNDKLILESTKTHCSYQVTTNGSQAIQRLRLRLAQTSKQFLQQILNFITEIVMYYQNITLDQIFRQLCFKLGFPFEFKIYNVPDFSQFALYFCRHIIHVQFIEGVFVAYSVYQPYETYQNHQGHRSSYSQDYHTPYNVQQPEQSRTTSKRNPSWNRQPYDGSFQVIPTPQFKSTTIFEPTQEKPNQFDNCNWMWENCSEEFCYKKEKGAPQDKDQTSKQIEENVNNLLQEAESRPPTVIVKNEQEEDPDNNNDFWPQSSKVEDLLKAPIWGQTSKNDMQHARTKSDAKPIVQHLRFPSNLNRK